MKIQKHDCKDELHNVFLKATQARVEIMRLLEKTTGPIDVFTLASELKKSNVEIDPATVFRIINILSEKELIKSVRFLYEDKTRYEASSKGDHHHLVCRSCGGIEDVSDYTIPDLEKEIFKEKKFLVTNHSLEFFGICENCQK